MVLYLATAIATWSDPIFWTEPTQDQTIFLVMRHGETYGNKPPTYIYTGSGTDFELNETGKKQAESIAKKIKMLVDEEKLKIDSIYSSPLQRALQTATPIAEALHLPIEERDNLKEISWGVADGQLVDEMDIIWDPIENEIHGLDIPLRDKWDLLPAIEGAEKFNRLYERVMSECVEIAKQHKGKVVLLSTHGRVAKCLTAAALNESDEAKVPYPQNTGIAVFSYSEGQQLKFLGVRNNCE